MYKLLFLFIVAPILAQAQDIPDKILTDTSMAIGIISEDYFGGKSVDSYCITGTDKYISKNSIVLISGIKNCKRSYSSELTMFYEFVYKKQTYFIQKEKIITNESYYSQIERMSPGKADSFRNFAIDVSKLLYESNIKKGLKYLETCKSKGLAILEWSFYDESEYTDGTSVKIKVYNPTPKTIKYLWFTFIGFNPVGDKVTDYKRGTNITMKGVGPIKTEESGTYSYEYVWFTDLVETAKILSIKIQYMDGSFKTIANPKEIIISKDLYEAIFEDE